MESNLKEWFDLVFKKLDEIDSQQRAQAEIFSRYREKIGRELSALNVKAGVWGLLGGMVPVIIVILLDHFHK